MKKIAILFLIFFYLIPAIGVSLDVHWCCHNLKIVDINSTHEKKCPCGKKMPPKCCRDYHVSAKLTQVQQGTDHVSVPSCNLIKIFNAESSICLFNIHSDDLIFDFTKYHAPPFKSKLPVYLDFSVFRI